MEIITKMMVTIMVTDIDKLKAHLDFGLSIYRLFTIYGDL